MNRYLVDSALIQESLGAILMTSVTWFWCCSTRAAFGCWLIFYQGEHVSDSNSWIFPNFSVRHLERGFCGSGITPMSSWDHACNWWAEPHGLLMGLPLPVGAPGRRPPSSFWHVEVAAVDSVCGMAGGYRVDAWGGVISGRFCSSIRGGHLTYYKDSYTWKHLQCMHSWKCSCENL